MSAKLLLLIELLYTIPSILQSELP